MPQSSPAEQAELLSTPILNALMLPEGGPRRGLLPATLPRSEVFLASYERNVLFYDAFWDVHGRDVILIGPPPIDLGHHYRTAKFKAVPSKNTLSAKWHRTPCVHVLSLRAPKGTTHIEVTFAGVTQQVPVGANQSEFFAGNNLLFTQSKNNHLAWIRDWARFHVVNQGVDAVVLFDNNSTRYGIDEVQATLLAVPGLKKVAVVPVPFTFPREDMTYTRNIFWADFLQRSVIVDLFRRFGMLTNGILNCDIDELAVPLTSETVFEAANKSRSGSVYYRFAWIESVPEAVSEAGYRHKDFRKMAADADYSVGPTTKWALTPKRRWMQPLKIQPQTHAVENRPMLTRHKPGNAFIAHFRGISTSWKYDRPIESSAEKVLRRDDALSQALDRAFAN